MKDKKLLYITFWRSFFVQSLWNFERMQNVGFAYTIAPFLRSIYPDKEKRKEAIIRHLGFFNIHPYMASIIIGIVASLEEEMARGKAIQPQEVMLIKTNMAGPLAAIGDSFFWATWRPFAALLASSLVLFFSGVSTFRGTWLVPLFFLLIYNMIHIPFRYLALKISYQIRTRVVRIIAGLEFQHAVDLIRLAGILVLAVVLGYYLAVFSSGIKEAAALFGVFVAVFLLGCCRIAPSIIFYATLLLCIIFVIVT